MYSLNNSIHPNFNGNLIFKISDLNNRLFENAVFNIKFIENQIKLDQSKINLINIGTINFSNFEYIERDNKLFFKSSMVLEVNDQKQFYRRIQISKKIRINLKKINFDLEKDIDENVYFNPDEEPEDMQTNVSTEDDILTSYTSKGSSNFSGGGGGY